VVVIDVHRSPRSGVIASVEACSNGLALARSQSRGVKRHPIPTGIVTLKRDMEVLEPFYEAVGIVTDGPREEIAQPKR
jgi:hypothetical protein